MAVAHVVLRVLRFSLRGYGIELTPPVQWVWMGSLPFESASGTAARKCLSLRVDHAGVRALSEDTNWSVDSLFRQFGHMIALDAGPRCCWPFPRAVGNRGVPQHRTCERCRFRGCASRSMVRRLSGVDLVDGKKATNGRIAVFNMKHSPST